MKCQESFLLILLNTGQRDKVDGFRFDLYGDHDAKTIQIAYDEAKKLNSNVAVTVKAGAHLMEMQEKLE